MVSVGLDMDVFVGDAEGRTVSTGSIVGSAVEQEAAANNSAKNIRSLVFMVIYSSLFSFRLI